MKTEEKKLQELENELTEMDLDQLKGGSGNAMADMARDQQSTYGDKNCCNSSW